MTVNAGEYRLGYRRDIEGLRAVAILLVIAAHAGVPGFSGGFIGVDVFFVLSGFLITGLLVQEITETGTLSFAAFYIRRLRRLMPALLVMLVCASLFALLVLAPLEQQSQAAAGASAAAWFSNIYFALERLDYFSSGTGTNIFLHTWSLGVEEQFYLIWPAFIYLLLFRRGVLGTGRLKVAMAVAGVVSLVACMVMTYKAPQFAFYMMPLRAWQFAVGALVWLHFNAPASKPVEAVDSSHLLWARRLVGWLGLSMLLGAGLLLGQGHAYPGIFALIPTLGAAWVIASGCCEQEKGAPGLLSAGLLQAIGRISYAWYLWHWPALLLGHALTGEDGPGFRVLYVAVSLVLAVASYYLIERPIRHQRGWLVHQRFAIYGSLLLVVACGLGFQTWNASAYQWGQSPAQLRYVEAQLDAPRIYHMDCDDWYHSSRLTPCEFGASGASHVAVLIGDSIAGQWFPSVEPFFTGPDWRLVVLTKSACPMVDQSYFYDRIGREFTECDVWRASAMKEIAKLHPDVVMVSSMDRYGFSYQEWLDASRRVMKVLSHSSKQIYVIRATPDLPFNGLDCLAERAGRPAWLKIGAGCSAKVSSQQSELVYAALNRAASDFDNVRTVDVNGAICPDGVCVAEKDGLIVFRDSMHMTATFAASIAPEFGRALNLASAQPSTGSVVTQSTAATKAL